MKANNSNTGRQQSFWQFCFSREQLWDWIVPALLCLVGYIALRSEYPYPLITSDSLSYLYAAINDQFMAYRPFGFSEWLRIIHVISPSIYAVFISHTLLYMLCTTLLILALKRYYPIRPAWLRWVVAVLIVASPMAFFMLDAVMSDALFGCMVILMVTMLMVVFYEGSYIALLIYFAAFAVALFTRYSGMFFAIALLPVLCFLPDKRFRLVGLVGTLLVGVIFYHNIYSNMNNNAHLPQFSTGFDGWQLANNALHIIPFIDAEAGEQPSDEEMRDLHYGICTHYRDFICEATDSGRVVTSVFMWSRKSPLKQYLAYRKQQTNASYQVVWAGLGGGLYADYGKWLIMHYPVEFFRYFLSKNIPYVFYPDFVELVGGYDPVPTDNREVPEWFGISPTEVTCSDNPIYRRYVCPVLPAIELFFWIVMAAALAVLLIRWKHWTMTRAQRLTFWLILLLGFVYCGSTAFAGPIALRYWFPLQALKLAFTVCCLYAALPCCRHEEQEKD